MKTKRILALVVAVCVGAVTPHVAQAGHWWWSGSQIVHLNKGHFPGISFYNKANNGSWTALEHARGDWSSDWAVDVGNWNSDAADVIAWDGYWSGAGWSGLATAYNWDGWHAGRFGVQINVASGSYASGANYSGTRAVACQEIGHAIGGMLHEGPGCMGVGYQVFDPWGDAAQRRPSGHDLEHLHHLWGNLH